MNVSKSVLVLGLMAALASCSSVGRGGSIAPLAFASGSSNTYISALGGGIVSRVNDVALNKSDKRLALEAEYKALEDAPGGQAVTWHGSGVDGKVIAAAPYQVGSQNCRQYTHTLTVGVREEVARGAACRNSDGTWTPLT